MYLYPIIKCARIRNSLFGLHVNIFNLLYSKLNFDPDFLDLEMVNKKDLVFALQTCVSKLPGLIDLQKSNKIAAVLIIIHFNQNSPHILLTKRNSLLTYHKGEVSFPGGAFVKHDRSLSATAIRETSEEIGVNIEERDILGCLKAVRTLTSNFFIYPFVTIQDKFLRPLASSSEVECIIDAPLFDLLHTLKIDSEHQHMSEYPLHLFRYYNQIIWGATASILKQLWDCLQFKES